MRAGFPHTQMRWKAYILPDSEIDGPVDSAFYCKRLGRGPIDLAFGFRGARVLATPPFREVQTLQRESLMLPPSLQPPGRLKVNLAGV